MKTLNELHDLCKKHGILLPEEIRNKKEEIQNRIMDLLWKQEHPGKPRTLQIKPMSLKSFSEVSPEQQQEAWESPRWLASVKIDGLRCIMQVGTGSSDESGSNILTSRRRSDINFRFRELQDNFPHIKGLSLTFLTGTVFDGELFSPVHDFKLEEETTKNQLQAVVALAICSPEKAIEFQRRSNTWMHYTIFDLLFHEGKDIRSYPFKKRREFLEEIFSQYVFGPYMHLEELVSENKKQFYTDCITKGLEGIVFKNIESPYISTGRPPNWFKLKKELTLDGWVSGFYRSKDKGSLKDLIGGFEISSYDDLGRESVIAYCSAMPLDLRKQATTINFDKIELNQEFLGRIVEVTGQDFSPKSQRLNHARIIRFRPDKPKEDCKIENINPSPPIGFQSITG